MINDNNAMSTQTEQQSERRASAASYHQDLGKWHQNFGPIDDNGASDKNNDDNGVPTSALKQLHQKPRKDTSSGIEARSEFEHEPEPEHGHESESQLGLGLELEPTSWSRTWSPPSLPLAPIDKFLLKPDDAPHPLPLLSTTGRRKTVSTRRVVFAPLTPPPTRSPPMRLRALPRGGPVTTTTTTSVLSPTETSSNSHIGHAASATDKDDNDGADAAFGTPQKQQGDGIEKGQKEEGKDEIISLLHHIVDAACIQCTGLTDSAPTSPELEPQPIAHATTETNRSKSVDSNMDEKCPAGGQSEPARLLGPVPRRTYWELTVSCLTFSLIAGPMRGLPKASKYRVPKWLGPAYIGFALIIFIQLLVLICRFQR